MIKLNKQNIFLTTLPTLMSSPDYQILTDKLLHHSSATFILHTTVFRETTSKSKINYMSLRVFSTLHCNQIWYNPMFPFVNHAMNQVLTSLHAPSERKVRFAEDVILPQYFSTSTQCYRYHSAAQCTVTVFSPVAAS